MRRRQLKCCGRAFKQLSMMTLSREELLMEARACPSPCPSRRGACRHRGSA